MVTVMSVIHNTRAVEDSVDSRVVLKGVSWDIYEALLAARGEGSRPKMIYLDGTLEFMTTSKWHEGIKTMVARLLEGFALATDLTLNGFGEMTLKREKKKSGAEPDECYVVGRRSPTPSEVPDIVIEVVWTHGGIDKLDVYSRLGANEVWIWIEGRLEIHQLDGEAYVEVARSRFIPDLDPKHLVSFVTDESLTDQTATVRRFMNEVAGSGK